MTLPASPDLQIGGAVDAVKALVIHGNRVITLKDEVQLAISGAPIFFDQLANQVEEPWVLGPLEAVLRCRPGTADERASSPFAVAALVSQRSRKFVETTILEGYTIYANAVRAKATPKRCDP